MAYQVLVKLVWEGIQIPYKLDVKLQVSTEVQRPNRNQITKGFQREKQKNIYSK